MTGFCGRHVGGGVEIDDARQAGDISWLLSGCGSFPSFLFGRPLRLEGFGLFQQDSAEAGDFLLREIFRIGVLLGWADQGTVMVRVGFADDPASRRAGSFFCLFRGFDGVALAVVLRGDLESVDEDLGAARVDAVGRQREYHVRDGQLDGVGVFEGRQVVDES
jgi:hypothetical protein